MPKHFPVLDNLIIKAHPSPDDPYLTLEVLTDPRIPPLAAVHIYLPEVKTLIGALVEAALWLTEKTLEEEL